MFARFLEHRRRFLNYRPCNVPLILYALCDCHEDTQRGQEPNLRAARAEIERLNNEYRRRFSEESNLLKQMLDRSDHGQNLSSVSADIHMYMYISRYICTCIYLDIYMYIYVYMYMDTDIHLCMCVYLYSFVCIQR